MEGKFKFWQKWFWVGIIISILSGPAGILFGFALLTESNLKKEGWTVVSFALIWTILVLSLLANANL